MAGRVGHDSTKMCKLYGAVRKEDRKNERRIIVPVIIHGDTYGTLVDTGASHSFINAFMVSM